ncbi:MAG: HAD family phosphatase [Sedimentisphaerales bacterium]|nr:HAD family phosphatase [Sedimentisphaerales bacterium]MBN2841986.1 HAD family phosphatase [Sedimentisphaerales bacterium]
MLKAFFFDLDGTLLCTEILWIEAMKAAASERGVEMDMAKATSLVIGRALTDIYYAVMESYPGIFRDLNDLDSTLYKYFIKMASERNTRIPGSVELLTRLADDGYPIAIVTGCARRDLENAIKEMQIADKLAFSLSCDDYHIGKPDPTCYKMAADRLGLDYHECCVFEDSTAGIRAAKAAGMKCVALVLEGMPAQDVSAADIVLNNLSDFKENMLGE